MNCVSMKLVDVMLKVGVSRVKISPPIGGLMDGFYLREGPSTGINDDINATALVIGDGISIAAIIEADILGFPPGLSENIKNSIELSTQISRNSILLLASHTHSGPALGNLRFLDADAEYLKFISDAITSSVVDASRHMFPCYIMYGYTEVSFSVNRRKEDGKGNVILADNYGGPVDRMLRVLRFVREDGADLAWVLNFGCHPTALMAENRLISRDYPGYACDLIESARPGSYALFINGGGANVKPRSDMGLEGFDLARECGYQLGRAVLAMEWKCLKEEKPQIMCLASKIAVPLEELLDPARVQDLYRQATGRPLAEEGGDAKNLWARANYEWAKDAIRMWEKGLRNPSILAEIQVLKLGQQTFLVSLPFEVFAETSLRLHSRFNKIATLLVCGYAGGLGGYLPTREEIPRGGYEVTEAFKVYGKLAPFRMDAEEIVRATAEQLIMDAYKPKC